MVQYPYRTTSHGIRLENIIPPTYSYSLSIRFLASILSVFQKKYPSCREDNLSELISRLWFKSWHNYTTTTLVVESCRGGQHLLNHGHSATLSPPKNEFTRQWIWIYMFSRYKNTWPWWTSLSESTKRLMTNGNHDWVLDRTLLVATWVPWPQAWHSPPSRRKRRRVSQWNFRKLSFEHLTSCGHSHENPKFLYACIIIWHICVYDLGRMQRDSNSSNRQVSAAALPCFHCPSYTSPLQDHRVWSFSRELGSSFQICLAPRSLNDWKNTHSKMTQVLLSSQVGWAEHDLTRKTALNRYI